MNKSIRLQAVLAYLLPVIGWLYVFFAARKNQLAMYHLRQATGLCLSLMAVLLGWVVIAWGVAWIPYMAVFSVASFALVIAACFGGIFAWIIGLNHALHGREEPLPLFGPWANHLPLR